MTGFQNTAEVANALVIVWPCGSISYLIEIRRCLNSQCENCPRMDGPCGWANFKDGYTERLVSPRTLRYLT